MMAFGWTSTQPRPLPMLQATIGIATITCFVFVSVHSFQNFSHLPTNFGFPLAHNGCTADDEPKRKCAFVAPLTRCITAQPVRRCWRFCMRSEAIGPWDRTRLGTSIVYPFQRKRLLITGWRHCHIQSQCTNDTLLLEIGRCSSHG